jgi:hypothetical protein
MAWFWKEDGSDGSELTKEEKKLLRLLDGLSNSFFVQQPRPVEDDIWWFISPEAFSVRTQQGAIDKGYLKTDGMRTRLRFTQKGLLYAIYHRPSAMRGREKFERVK